ncbi:MAG: uroporphyrinogen-III C-methyltransferase [Sandaracinaceae bacterium]|nr:uroporphyrinogen-III C-methyltransferase [Sandaracinaceae bacterium]
MAKPRGRVVLCGAGPGDPELVSLKAVRRLGEADLVLYDALVHPDVLRHAPASAVLEFVGKRAGRPSERQERINARMVAAAREGKLVVRLKGGDPYLFGRGSEEAEHLAAHGVPFEVVPGVPSSLAATAYAGIALTHRARSSSVLYLTATESPDKDRSSHEWDKLATAAETLVIFMGMRKLPELMRLLVEHGRDPATPAAVIESASLPRQRCVVGTVATIGERARAAGLGLPALTVIGDVVALRETLRWYDAQPLFGKRVLVTRPAHQSDETARLLREEGAEAVLAPAIRIVGPRDPAPLREAVARMGYDWIVLTSANGVAALFEEIARQGRDARALGGARVCAIGPATAEALRAHGVRADVIPDEYRGEGAAEAILASGDVRGRRVLLPRAEVAREALPDLLRERGAHVDVVPAYRTVGPSEDDAATIRDVIHRKLVDVVTFTSPSTVREVAGALGAHADALAEGFTLACIGPVTADAAEARGWPVHVVPTDYTAEGLVDALREAFA